MWILSFTFLPLTETYGDDFEEGESDEDKANGNQSPKEAQTVVVDDNIDESKKKGDWLK